MWTDQNKCLAHYFHVYEMLKLVHENILSGPTNEKSLSLLSIIILLYT